MRANQADYPVATMCRLLGVSTSGYYAWCKRGPSRRAQKDAELTAKIRRCHEASNGIYGAPKIHAELVLEALDMGLGQRRPDGVTHHSVQGCQYTIAMTNAKARRARQPSSVSPRNTPPLLLRGAYQQLSGRVMDVWAASS